MAFSKLKEEKKTAIKKIMITIAFIYYFEYEF